MEMHAIKEILETYHGTKSQWFFIINALEQQGFDYHHDVINEEGDSIVHAIVKQGNVKDLKYIAQLDSITNRQNVTGKTPLLTAIEQQKQEMVLALIKNNADVSLGDNNHVTPIHLAAYYCDSISFHHISSQLMRTGKKDALFDNDVFGNDIFNHLIAKKITGYALSSKEFQDRSSCVKLPSKNETSSEEPSIASSHTIYDKFSSILQYYCRQFDNISKQLEPEHIDAITTRLLHNCKTDNIMQNADIYIQNTYNNYPILTVHELSSYLQRKRSNTDPTPSPCIHSPTKTRSKSFVEILRDQPTIATKLESSNSDTHGLT